jgi:hypothetical protein
MTMTPEYRLPPSHQRVQQSSLTQSHRRPDEINTFLIKSKTGYNLETEFCGLLPSYWQIMMRLCLVLRSFAGTRVKSKTLCHVNDIVLAHQESGIRRIAPFPPHPRRRRADDVLVLSSSRMHTLANTLFVCLSHVSCSDSRLIPPSLRSDLICRC